MSIRRKGLVPIVLGVLWTAAAASAAWLVLERPPRILEVGGHPYFLAGIGEVLGIWIWGAVLVAALAVSRPALRMGALAGAAVLGVAMLLAWFAPTLEHREPQKAGAAELESVATDRTTLLVAVDGMSWTAILPMVRQGELPTFARLMEEGSYGVLHSLRSYRETVDRWGYWSSVVWTSMATGVGPRRHGIVDFTIAEGRGRRVAASYHREAPAFWNLFSAFGRTVGVVGWWASWPAEEVSGYMASSHLGLRGIRRGEPPSYGLTYPEELAPELQGLGLEDDELRSWVHEAVFPFDYYPILDGDELRTMYSVLWQDRLYQDLALELIPRHRDVDLHAVYFEGIDALSHHFWAAMESEHLEAPPTLPAGFDEHRYIVPAYYRVVDGYLEELLSVLPADVTVIVVSDHGFELDPTHSKGADHSPYGVVIARGPGIVAGKSVNLGLAGSLRERAEGSTDVLDVLPTLLYLHGLPVARDLPGDILTGFLTDRLLERVPLIQVESYGRYDGSGKITPVLDPEASEEYQERLKALGYIQ